VSLGLRSRLALTYAAVALLCVLLVSVLANGVLEDQFRRYVRDGQVARSRQVVDLMAGQAHADGTWDGVGVEAIGMNALEQGMIVKVVSADGRTVWDAMTHNNGLCQQMITHMAANMSSRYGNWKGSYTEASFPVRTDFRAVGSVSVGYYGPFYFRDQDLAFINALNRLLVWVGLAALALAVAVGLAMARGISVPLSRVEKATLAIAAGDLSVRIEERSRVREIRRISTAVNGLAAELRSQESLRKRLTADLAHEMRTPLATLQSHLEALMDGVWTPDAARLAGLHAEALRLTRMVSDMESLARLESDSLAVQLQRMDLAELAASLVSHHEAQFRAKGVELRLGTAAGGAQAAPPAAVPVFGDRDRLSQALINLLSNALKYTPEGGSVEVSVRCERGVEPRPRGSVEPRPRGGEAVISVVDTGIGISAEDLPRVFERLYRVESSRSRATGGSGIGLAITRAIVEAHGGKISAASVPGRGSEFTIRLPLAEGG
jgi:two-component system, OmpR family, sensor histidine kinase BaeS